VERSEAKREKIEDRREARRKRKKRRDKIEKKRIKSYTFYYIKGTKILHREDGPAVESRRGDREWYLNGELHREYGPAAIWDDGTIEWYKHGKRHRVCGPAVTFSDGEIQWWLEGHFYPRKESWFEALAEEQKVKILYSEFFINQESL
jgi:hypothetical protein